MRKKLLILFFLFFACFRSFGMNQEELQQLKRDFIDMRFGMFICFNIMTYGADWCEANYPKEKFNPGKLDCKQWADAAVSAGMKYGLLTTKHPEGFCLWDSAYTDYDVKGSPYKRDVVRQYVDAFRERGLKIGLYYSIWDSTHEVDVGKMDASKNELIRGQIKELLSNYGKIDYFVLDGWFWRFGHKEVNWIEIRELIRELQPDCLVTDHTHLQAPYHSDIPYYEGPFGAYPDEGNQMASAQGHCSVNGNGWFWGPDTPNGMIEGDGVELILKKLKECEARYCNFMLNCMPNRDGLLDPVYIDLLKDIGERWSPYKSRPSLPDQGAQIVHSVPVKSVYATSGYAENLNSQRKVGGGNYFHWVAQPRPFDDQFPQIIRVDFGEVVEGVDSLLIVQNHRCKPYPEVALSDGNITHCKLYASCDNQNYQDLGEWKWEVNHTYRSIGFPRTKARYLKLEILDAVGGNPVIAEIEVGRSKE